ncbi:hypothetical protein WR25_08985 [Diploscapter pachys]|uniref:aECM cysteine-cradle domain-containing protein n=1 Tax=Diploscapter pachys TaxID=2018661 RepID=A0A2A2M1P4_9BILA|nr:hypothetical protein WR25_08985 [Diploscapter pachys]
MVRVVDNYEKKLNSINDKLTPIRGKVKRYRCIEEYVTLEEWEHELAQSRARVRNKYLHPHMPTVYFTTTLPPEPHDIHEIKTTEYEIKPTEKPTSTETTAEKVKHTSTNRIDAETTTQNWEEMDDSKIDELIEKMYLKEKTKKEKTRHRYIMDKDGNFHINREEGTDMPEIRRKPIAEHKIAYMIDSNPELEHRNSYRKPTRFRKTKGRYMRKKVKPFKRLIYRPKNIKQMPPELFEPPPERRLRPVHITIQRGAPVLAPPLPFIEPPSELPPPTPIAPTPAQVISMNQLLDPSPAPTQQMVTPIQAPPQIAQQQQQQQQNSQNPQNPQPTQAAPPSVPMPSQSVAQVPAQMTFYPQAQQQLQQQQSPQFGMPPQEGPVPYRPPENGGFEKATKENCKRMRQIASMYGVTDITGFARRNCAFLQTFVPGATCEQIFRFVDSCKDQKFLL